MEYGLKHLFFFVLLISWPIAGCNSANAQTQGTPNMHKYTNHLINETSPYLLQHAHNPVEWYPWGEEAFRLAKEENKPILLSVGYAACHWCHVMEKESFENEETAALMNKLFINIKVDREERPDVDQIYMAFLQMTTGSGGWPMTVFLTPDREPFYGGTYFPPEDRYGRPGFKRLLQMVSDFFHNNKQELHKNLEQVQRAFNKRLKEERSGQIPGSRQFNQAVEELMLHYEPDFGGIGGAPKFPAVQALRLFLRRYKNQQDENALHMVTFTLKNMGRGGIYDQLGGGFARYSVDKQWLVPHFEKMLYDNAQLAVLYLETFQATGDPFFLETAEGTLGFVLNNMTSAQGGFYSSYDADSDGEEGTYYLWRKDEIEKVLDGKAAQLFNARYGVTGRGNFDGKNILHVAKDVRQLVKEFDLSLDGVRNSLSESRQALLQERQKRVPPALDDKIIASWNGLMLSAFAKAYQITGKAQYEKAVRNNVRFLQKQLTKHGELLHTYKDGRARFTAYLDDYADVIAGLSDAYEALFETPYLQWAIQLADVVNQNFWDEEHSGYFYTSAGQEKLLHRLKDKGDQSVPSGTGIMLQNMLRFYFLTNQEFYLKRSETILAKYGPQFTANPYSYASYLNALDFYLQKPQEIVLVQWAEQPLHPLLQAVHGKYLPNKVMVLKRTNDPLLQIAPALLEGRESVNKQNTVYLCYNYTCSLPVNSPKELVKLLF